MCVIEIVDMFKFFFFIVLFFCCYFDFVVDLSFILLVVKVVEKVNEFEFKVNVFFVF